MRKFLFLPLLALLASCGKNEDCDIVTPQPEDLVSPALYATLSQSSTRSEERRVGKECTSWCRSRWSPYH